MLFTIISDATRTGNPSSSDPITGSDREVISFFSQASRLENRIRDAIEVRKCLHIVDGFFKNFDLVINAIQSDWTCNIH